MPAQSHHPNTKAAPPPKPLAWWKKLLIAVFGTYIAAKLFGLIVPDVSAAGIFPHTDGDGHTEKPPIPTDEYPDDTWDYPAEDRCEDEIYTHEDDLSPAEDLYNDWDDWNEGMELQYEVEVLTETMRAMQIVGGQPHHGRDEEGI